MKKVFIVSITFNSSDDTHACLFSLAKLRTTGIDLAIVIVDNASQIPFTLTNSEKKQGIILLRNDNNTGFSGGNNVGIQYAMDHAADYVMLLNNDTHVDIHLVSSLVAALDQHSMIGIVSPKIYFAKGREFHHSRYTPAELGHVLWYAGGSMDWNNVTTVHRGVDAVDTGQYGQAMQTGFATGCCMMLPREVIEKAGMLDDRYFLYYEDADLNERVKRCGYSVWYVPSGIVWHSNAASSGGSGSLLHDYFLTRNRLVFGFRYAPVRTRFALLRESIRLLLTGREWQKKGIMDFIMGKLGRGSFAV